MEVMFAVAILAIGLVFLACQFPVGMFAARDNADQTRKVIEVHNSQVMAEVQLSLVNRGRILDNRGNQNWNNPKLDLDIIRMHFLPKPNVYSNSILMGAPELVLDDPEGDEGYIAYLLDNKTPVNNPMEVPPDPPFWSAKGPLVTDFSYTSVFLEDIGHMMSPPVDETDPKVQKLMRWGRSPEEAIFEAALESNYCWAMFYREGYEKYYIFTLRNPQKEVRYAVQTPNSFLLDQSGAGRCYGTVGAINSEFTYNTAGSWPSPAEPDDAALDRKFPVPWRVCLGEYSIRYRVDVTEPERYGYDDQRPGEFILPEIYADLLLPGSILIDADPYDTDHDGTGRQTTGGCGNIYEVTEVYRGNDGLLRVRLRTDFHDDLHYFWVFPPPIDRATGAFDNWQPVVSVTKKLMDFD